MTIRLIFPKSDPVISAGPGTHPVNAAFYYQPYLDLGNVCHPSHRVDERCPLRDNGKVFQSPRHVQVKLWIYSLSGTWYCQIFLSHSNRCSVVSHGFNLHFTIDVEHLFYRQCSHISSLVQFLFKSFANFHIGLCVSLLLSFESSFIPVYSLYFYPLNSIFC